VSKGRGGLPGDSFRTGIDSVGREGVEKCRTVSRWRVWVAPRVGRCPGLRALREGAGMPVSVRGPDDVPMFKIPFQGKQKRTRVSRPHGFWGKTH